jgi:CRISPR/Cas system-associated exonuclease Cas4 (RecB family)
MHEIFQRIKSADDIKNALISVQLEGKISEPDIGELNITINNLLKQKMIQPWFSKEWDIYTEASILLEDGSNLRPDRVLIKNNKAVVIDYKFGKNENDSHKRQVRNYMNYLSQMNYDNIVGYLWYVTLDIVVPVEM